MRTVEEFIDHLAGLDIKLWAEDDGLCFSAPKGALTETLRAELAENKEGIIAFLKNTAGGYSQKPIGLASRDNYLPLSFYQEQIWFLEQVEGINSTYNMMSALNIKGELNINALEQSLNEVIKRHEILRTTFPAKNGMPLQVIHPYSHMKLPVVNLEGILSEGQFAAVKEMVNKEAFRSFNLSEGPLLRAALYRLNNIEHVLLLAMHHIISDGWSMGVLFKEISQIYAAFYKGEPSSLKELSVQFADYACWQRKCLNQDVLASHASYWKKQLAGAPLLSELPTDRPRPPVQTYKGRTEYFKINSGITARLNGLSRETGTTLFMTLLASFALLLSYNSNQEDIAIGSPVANRGRKEIEPLIGYFVNTVALRVDLSGDPTFAEYLGKVKRMVLDAYEHQDLPFDKLVKELKPSRSLSYSPLFQIMLVLQNTPVSMLELPGLSVSDFGIDNPTAKLDLSLSIAQDEQGLIGAWEYNTDLFNSDTIRHMAEQFEIVLEWVANNPGRKISGLSLLTEAERHRLLVECNSASTSYPKDKCIHELFEEQAEKRPDAAAVVCDGRQLTYGELNSRADKLAGYLRTLDVGPEVLVGISVERSLEMIVGILGVLKAGGVYVPMDPSYPAERLAFILKDAGISILLTQEHLSHTFRGNAAQVICLDTDWDAINAGCQEEPGNYPTSDNAAYIIYTSGSTGRPKGVIVTHKNVLALLHAFENIAPSSEKLAGTSVCPFGFDVSVWEFFSNLCFGGELHILKSATYADPKCFVDYLKKNSVTSTYIPPALLPYVADVLEKRAEGTTLKRILVGVEPIRQETLQRFRDMSPEMHIINGYGPTETTICATFFDFRQAVVPELRVPIGKVVPGYKVYIVNRQIQPVPTGVPGEILIGGDGVARGYFNHPELTADKFMSDPFSSEEGSRVYRTGDLARYLPDGNIEFSGRMDHQVKIRGYRIELGEIESAVVSHSCVKEAVVVIREDNPGDKRIVAYVVTNGDSNVSMDELHRHVKEWLPDYMVPTAFVKMDKLPLNPNGKIDREALPTPAQKDTKAAVPMDVKPLKSVEQKLIEITETLLDVKGISVTDNFFTLGGNSLLIIRFISEIEEIFNVTLTIADFIDLPVISDLAQKIEMLLPKDLKAEETENAEAYKVTEQKLIAIAEELLNVSAISGSDNFFDLGGNSLLIIQFISKVEDAFNVTLTIADFIELPTISELAKKIGISAPAVSDNGKKIELVSRDGDIPLSFSQEQLWFLEQLEGIDSTYTIYTVMHLKGQLRVNVLERSLNEVIKRHEILRTTFSAKNGAPVQIINTYSAMTIPVVDLGNVAAEDRALRVEDLINKEISRRFDLANGPLLRAALYRLSDGEHVFLLAMHHIISDGWSMGVLFNEVSKLYTAYCYGEDSPLKELPVQFADYACWQRKRLCDDTASSHMDYWKKQLGGAPPILELPTDRPRPAIQTYRGRTIYFKINSDLSARVNKLSQQSGTMLYMTLLAAYATLLSRTSSQDDIVIGSPVANRSSKEIEPLIGYFVNTLALRVDLSGDPTFSELLGRIHRVVLDAFEHQHIPFENIVAELKPERRLNSSPLFQVMFHLQNAPVGMIDMPGISISEKEMDNPTSKFDLTLSISETEQGLSGDWEYNTDLFDSDTIERMTRQLEIVLEWAVNNPMEKISELSLLTEMDRHRLLLEWNATDVPYPKDKCIHQLFEEQAVRKPDEAAVVFENKQLTYRELNHRADALAGYLRSLGVEPEVPVSICADRSLEMIVGILGILKAGGAYVPIDTKYPHERISYILKDCKTKILLTKKNLENKVNFEGRKIYMDEDSSYEQNPVKVESANTPDNLAYIMYTSGSTGKPKGVMVEHKNVVRLVKNTDYVGFDEGDRILQTGAIAFDASTFEIWGSLLNGLRLYMVDERVILDTAEFEKAINEYGITTMFLTTALFNKLSNQNPEIFKGLKNLLFGGEAASPRNVNSVAKSCDNVRVIHCYGPTENTTFSTCLTVKREYEDNVPIGRPISNSTAYILDRNNNLQPTGVIGELCVGGDGVARGYLNAEELTKEKFVPNPFVPDGRMYKTGDLARYLPDGTIEFSGRMDQQVKIRGYRIELGEIEATLLNHPDVKEALVAVREDNPGDKRIVAYLVMEQSMNTSIDDLCSYLGQWLPNYMVPTAFVTIEALPLNANGKIDKKRLPEPEVTINSNKVYKAPETAVEKKLVEIMERLLNVKGVGIHDNFFDFGGNSLLIIGFISEIEDAFGVTLSVADFMESSTVWSLAEKIDMPIKCNLTTHTKRKIESVSRKEALPLSFSQEQLWFLEQLEGIGSTYTIAAAMHLKGQLYVNVLGRSLNEVIRRHEILRTIFLNKNGLPVQVIHPYSPITLPVEELGISSGEEELLKVRKLMDKEIIRGFDLANGPLFRAVLYRLNDVEHVLLLAMHHIISDGWSMGVLFKEVSEIYTAFYSGKPCPMEELQIQYVDYACWQRERLSGEDAASHMAYWKKQLEGAPPILELPTDRPRPLIQAYKGRSKRFNINSDLMAKVNKLSQQSGNMLYMTLLAAFAVLLSRSSNQEDIVIGSPVANRANREVEPLIGYFVNILALRVDLSGDPTFLELLDRVRQMVLDALDNQETPFEKLVSELKPERSLSSSPLFQVMFHLQNVSAGILEMPELSVYEMDIENPTAKFDLILTIVETENRLLGNLEYNIDLFDAASIERIAQRFEIVLEWAVNNSGKKLSELSLLTEQEQHQLISEWNATGVPYPKDKCIHQLFEEQVVKNPDATAVVFGNKKLTYSELNNRANQLAQKLRSLGVGPEVMVGIYTERSLEMVIGILGILKAGGAYVPIDPEYPHERIRYILNDCRTEILLTKKNLGDKVKFKGWVICLDEDNLYKGICENIENQNVPDSLAYVIYTSGSMGKPKGVMVEHKNVVRLVINTNYVDLKEDDRILQTGAIVFDASTFEIWGALLNGLRLYLVDDNVILDAAKLEEAINEYGITTLWLTSALFNQLSSTKPGMFKGLRNLLVGGDVLSPVNINLVKDCCRDVRVINGYGPTENTTFSTCFTIEERYENNIPIGKPISNSTAYIVDKNNHPQPVGIYGELCVGGDGVARGYLNQEELTKEKFVPDPFVPGGRMYKTGDKVRYLPDGNIEFWGRIDRQIKLRGFRIEPGEIETAILSHPAVRETAVVVREDNPGDKRIVAYIVVDQSMDVSIEELYRRAGDWLPGYMIPSAFVKLEAMPLNPNRKIDREALPVPQGMISSGEKYVAPKTAAEKKLIEICEGLLDVKGIGIHDNFFSSGGNSLLIIRFISKIEDEIGVTLSVADIMESPILSDLAKKLEVLKE